MRHGCPKLLSDAPRRAPSVALFVHGPVDGVLHGGAAPEPITESISRAPPATAAPSNLSADESGGATERNLVSSSSEYCKLYLGRFKAASRSQLQAARTTLDDVRQLIDAQLQLTRDEGEGAP